MPTRLTTEITSKVNGDQAYTLLLLSGQIDENNLDHLIEVVDPLIGVVERHLVFNLRELDFINSKVIGYFANTRGKLSTSKQKMIFVEANSNIFDILELVGLTQIVPTLESETHALKALERCEI